MFRFRSLFLASLAVPAFAAFGAHTSRQLQTSTIVDLAVATADLSTLVTAVTEAGLADALSDPQATLTVFAPSNNAFSALPNGLLDALLTPGFKKHLTEILLYHVFTESAILSADLGAAQDITMLNGEALTVTKTGFGATVTTTSGQVVQIITADVEGSNGVVHIINGVLVPSSIGASVIDLGSDYSTLLSLIVTVGFDQFLSEGVESDAYTLFAPTNAAFEALDAATLAFLTSDEGAFSLFTILLYHIAIGSVTSDLVEDGAMAETLLNQKIAFSVGESVMVNDATVIEPDMLALNGVSHGIDRVLLPGTVEDVLLDIQSLSTLASYAITAGVTQALRDPEATLTLFSPDNNAFFDNLPESIINALLTRGFRKHLIEILSYHVSAEISPFEVLAEETQEIVMLNGEMLTVTANEEELSVTTTKGQTVLLITADVDYNGGFDDIGARNGALYIINGVLLPSSIGNTVIDLGSDYSTLLSLITRAGLEETLAGGPFTLLAPTNMAFAALETATVELLTSDAGAAMLTSILTYHVISGSVTSDMLENDMMVETVEGRMVTFMVEGDTVMVNDATVVMADMLAFNGVSHGINKILMPDAAPAAAAADNMAPTMAPASGAFAVGASLSALFAAVMALAL
jgi:transforming growth factor-beta-induced protein